MSSCRTSRRSVMAEEGAGEQEEKNRLLRLQARRLLKKTEDDADELANPAKPHWDTYYNKTGKVFDQVDRPREAASEQEVFVKLAQFAVQAVEETNNANTGYNAGEFVDSLREKFFERNGGLGEDSGDFHWLNLGKALDFSSCSVPRIEFMFGPVDIVAKQKKAPKKRVRAEEPTQLTQPGKVDSRQEKKHKQTRQSKRIKTMRKALQTRSAEKDFFPLVLNPDSFTQTVENIFDYSFLVKQGRASIRMKDGVPVARPEEQGQALRFKTTQTVASFTMKDWRELCELHELQNGAAEIQTRPDDDEEEEEEGEDEEDHDEYEDQQE